MESLEQLFKEWINKRVNKELEWDVSFKDYYLSKGYKWKKFADLSDKSFNNAIKSFYNKYCERPLFNSQHMKG